MKPTKSTSRISIKNLPELSVAVKCADCLHFDIQAHAEFKKPCKDLGIKAYARGCDKYNPNVARLARSVGAMEAVFDMVGSMTESELRLLVISAYKSSAIEKGTGGKYKFGSKVYFNLSAPYAEYIDSYYSGVVIGFIEGDESSPNGYLHIGGSLSDSAGTSITLPIDIVLNQSKWNITFRKLANANKFQTPSSKRLRFECSEETSPEEYEVPTLDTSVEAISKLNSGKKRGTTKAETFRETAYDDEDESELQEDEAEVKVTKPKRTKKGGGETQVITFK